MSPSTTHACTNCNTPVPALMRFCPNCGTPANAGNGHPADYTPSPAAPSYNNTYPSQAPQGQQQGYQPSFQSSQPPPAYARPQKNSSGGLLKVVVILLLLMLILGTAGFFVFRSVSSRGGNAANTGTHNDVTPTQASLTTTPINTTFTYASVNITILNAQQATSFADDHDTPAQGVVRLNLGDMSRKGTSSAFLLIVLDFTIKERLTFCKLDKY